MVVSEYKLCVRGYELDSSAHVNNAVYLNYAETAVWAFLHKKGAVAIANEYGYIPVMLENNIRYINELRLFDEVVIRTEWEVSESLMRCKHVMKRVSDNALICKVNCKMALVSSKERIICSIPKAFIEQFNQGE